MRLLVFSFAFLLGQLLGANAESDEELRQLYLKRDIEQISRLAEAGDGRAQAWMGLLSQHQAKYLQARNWYEMAATSGNQFAIGQLVFLHQRGLGTPRNLAKSAEWMRRGAELGHPVLQAQYATMLLEGQGIDRDETEAVRWYRQAVERGECNSALPLAKLARDGIGIERDTTPAYAYARFASYCLDSSATDRRAEARAIRERLKSVLSSAELERAGNIFESISKKR